MGGRRCSHLEQWAGVRTVRSRSNDGLVFEPAGLHLNDGLVFEPTGLHSNDGLTFEPTGLRLKLQIPIPGAGICSGKG